MRPYKISNRWLDLDSILCITEPVDDDDKCMSVTVAFQNEPMQFSWWGQGDKAQAEFTRLWEAWTGRTWPDGQGRSRSAPAK